MSVLSPITTGMSVLVLTIVMQGCAVSNAIQKRHVSDNEIRNMWRIIQEEYAFEFKPKPHKPQWNEPVNLSLVIKTISNESSKPVTNALISCIATMPPDQPNMEGLLHSYKKHSAHEEVFPGTYSFNMVFAMGGEWIITYDIKLQNKKKFQVTFPIRVKRPEDKYYEWETIQPKVSDD